MRIVPYLLAAPLGIATFFCSKGLDGKPIAMLGALGIIGLLYIIALVITTRRAFTWHSFGHLILFQSVAWITLGRDLDEMAGMLYLFLPIGILVLIACGAIALLATNKISKKKQGLYL